MISFIKLKNVFKQPNFKVNINVHGSTYVQYLILYMYCHYTEFTSNWAVCKRLESLTVCVNFSVNKSLFIVRIESDFEEVHRKIVMFARKLLVFLLRFTRIFNFCTYFSHFFQHFHKSLNSSYVMKFLSIYVSYGCLCSSFRIRQILLKYDSSHLQRNKKTRYQQ